MVLFGSNLYCFHACMSLLLVFGFIANCSSLTPTTAIIGDEVGVTVQFDDPVQIGIVANMSTQALCKTGNAIDDCWRCDPDWLNNRKHLADCAIGFGKTAKGGRDGRIYIVDDPSDNDTVDPTPGTLRHAVIQTEPLWIVFAEDMVITLKHGLMMNSFKTIDGRGFNVQIANGGGIRIQNVTNIIIHGVQIHNCKPTESAMVRSSPSVVEEKDSADGDAISISNSKHVWIDHNSLSNCSDGLVDVVKASTAVTISNNLFTHHVKVMLLGNDDAYIADKIMQVTVAYNRFGEGLSQRLPRVRHGNVEVVNNDYPNGWAIYAIGGSANPTINSQGNRFSADPKYPDSDEVTKRPGVKEEDWKPWNWRSSGDIFLNGALFVPSGDSSSVAYEKASSILARPASLVRAMTANAGVLTCHKDGVC